MISPRAENWLRNLDEVASDGTATICSVRDDVVDEVKAELKRRKIPFMRRKGNIIAVGLTPTVHPETVILSIEITKEQEAKLLEQAGQSDPTEYIRQLIDSPPKKQSK